MHSQKGKRLYKMGKLIIKITTRTARTTGEEEIIAEITITEVIVEDITKTIRVMEDTVIITIEEKIKAEVTEEETIEEITLIITFLTIISEIMIRMLKLQ